MLPIDALKVHFPQKKTELNVINTLSYVFDCEKVVPTGIDNYCKYKNNSGESRLINSLNNNYFVFFLKLSVLINTFAPDFEKPIS